MNRIDRASVPLRAPDARPHGLGLDRHEIAGPAPRGIIEPMVGAGLGRADAAENLRGRRGHRGQQDQPSRLLASPLP